MKSIQTAKLSVKRRCAQTLITKMFTTTNKKLRCRSLYGSHRQSLKRRPLNPERTGVKLDGNGFIIVNDYLDVKKSPSATPSAMMFNMPPTRSGIVWHNSTMTKLDGFLWCPYCVCIPNAAIGLGSRMQTAPKILVGKLL